MRIALFMLLGLVAVVALAVVWLICLYNGLVKGSRLKDEAWSGVAVQLKRRHDLVPNLVETVRAYAGHEKSTLEAIAAMRSPSFSGRVTAQTVGEAAAAENSFNSALGRIFALAENYPELKANTSFNELQRNLAEIEDHLQMARRYFNGTVRDYNIRTETFPSVIIARLCAFTPVPFFELESPEESRAPTVRFDSPKP